SEDDTREVDDRQPNEPERFSFGPERVPHHWKPTGSEDVDRDVHHNPHYVDEVPIDSSDLDSVVVLGSEVPSERTDGHDQEDRQADEDVETVKAGQAEERG